MGDLISIIVPIYNAKDYLEVCLQSLIKQTYSFVEVILVNDGSTDGSEIICEEYAYKYKNVIFINVKNGGVSSARNIGLEHARGKYIGFVDADDYVSETMFEELLTLIESKGGFDLAACEVYNKKKIELSVLTPEQGIYNIFDTNSYSGYVCNKLFRKEIIDSINLRFSNNIFVCEDTLFCFKYIQQVQKNIIYTTKRLYHYIKHEESSFNKAFNSKQFTVVYAFNQIIENASAYSEKTINMIKSNYVLIVLKMCAKTLYSNNKNDIRYYKEMKGNIKSHFKIFLLNTDISIKYRLFGMIILYFPFVVRFAKYGR